MRHERDAACIPSGGPHALINERVHAEQRRKAERGPRREIENEGELRKHLEHLMREAIKDPHQRSSSEVVIRASRAPDEEGLIRSLVQSAAIDRNEGHSVAISRNQHTWVARPNKESGTTCMQ